MSYDLRKTARDFVDQTDLTDFKAMAAELAAKVPAKHLREALVEALPYLLSTINQQRRMSNPILAGASPAPTRSPKVAAIAAAHEAALRDLVHVGGGVNKQLGDCGYEDLMFAAEERRALARKTLARADKFETLAQRLHAAGVARVADLPAADLADLGVAA